MGDFLINEMFEQEHEQVVFCTDKATGLKAIIAIHNTVLGPSLGGTRMWNYANVDEALKDVLRLSKGMTLKSSLAGLNLGGGKAVIIGDPHTQKNEFLFRRFGKFVNSLGGKYITAEDVGVSPKEMTWINMETEFVSGLPGKSGDPSPLTANGTYYGMKAAAKKIFGSDSLNGKKISIQGVGHVGEFLLQSLVNEGAIITVTDSYQPTLERISKDYKVNIVNSDEIYDCDVDIFSPNALGAIINDDTISRLKCKIIAGAANNQLADTEKHGQELIKRNIAYVPDFLINAGGIINCYFEVIGYDRTKVNSQIENIYDTTLDIFEKAEKENKSTHNIAVELAMDRINKISNIKKYF